VGHSQRLGRALVRPGLVDELERLEARDPVPAGRMEELALLDDRVGL
jgi:hypothetical protein